MPKQTRIIRQTETLELISGNEAAIANVSNVPVFVLTTSEEQDVDALDLDTRNRVMNAMYRLFPGDRRELSKGIYRVMIPESGAAFVAFNGKITPRKTEPVTAEQ